MSSINGNGSKEVSVSNDLKNEIADLGETLKAMRKAVDNSNAKKIKDAEELEDYKEAYSIILMLTETLKNIISKQIDDNSNNLKNIGTKKDALIACIDEMRKSAPDETNLKDAEKLQKEIEELKNSIINKFLIHLQDLGLVGQKGFSVKIDRDFYAEHPEYINRTRSNGSNLYLMINARISALKTVAKIIGSQYISRDISQPREVLPEIPFSVDVDGYDAMFKAWILEAQSKLYELGLSGPQIADLEASIGVADTNKRYS